MLNSFWSNEFRIYRIQLTILYLANIILFVFVWNEWKDPLSHTLISSLSSVNVSYTMIWQYSGSWVVTVLHHHFSSDSNFIHDYNLVKWSSTSPLIFSIPFSFPTFPSMVVVQEWHVILSMHNFRIDTPSPAVWEGDKVGAFCMGLLCAWLAASIKLDTDSLSCCEEVREGTKVTVRPICAGLSLTSSTPWIWDNFSRASCCAAGVRPEVRITWVSVETGVVVLDSERLDSKPMSSMASDRDSGLCWLGSNMTVAFSCSKDTYQIKVKIRGK